MSNSTAPRGKSWLTKWEPENDEFWNATGKKVANAALVITTANLFLAFITWFVVSALVVKLPQIGFKLTTAELFWLTAMPGLAAGTWRLVHMFLTPMLGTRLVVSVSTLLLLIPLVGWYVAVQDPTTPFWVLMFLAFCAGMGGGNFSSFMPSTTLFFPKKKLGTALAIQAGIGNLGVSVVQFLTPWIIGFALAGSLFGAPQTLTKGTAQVPVYLQNALTIYIPLVVVFGGLAWLMLKSVPIKANFKEQFDIFKSGHTWALTSLYLMTFGAFSGLSGTFPLLIKQTFGGIPNAPDPLAFAFLGPLVGAVVRVATGPFADKWGGAKITTLAGVGMTVCSVLVLFFTANPTAELFVPFVASMLGIFFFAGMGNASTFKQMPMLFAPRQGSGVVGFTAAIAAFGPFIYGLLFAFAFATFKSPNVVFIGSAVFFGLNTVLNWWLYSRKNAKHPC
ncbi:MAG: MFS transporter [Spirochaetales bacterium]